ncbi:MAG: TRAM domain-containing protein, partial [Acidobacteria bacterium]
MRHRAGGADRADAIAVDIVKMSPDGDGLARLEGEDLFVPYAIPGERVEVAVHRGRDGALAGELVRVVRASPDRITPRCRHFGYCGGCAWQHIAYPAQLRHKQAMLQEMLAASMGAAAPAVLP